MTTKLVIKHTNKKMCGSVWVNIFHFHIVNNREDTSGSIVIASVYIVMKVTRNIV